MSLMADLKKNIRFKNWLNHIDGWLIVPCVTVVCVYRLCRGFSWSLVWTERSYTSLTTSVTTSETQRCVCLSVSLSVCEYVCVWSARTAHGDVTALEGNGISSRWLQDEKPPSGQPPPVIMTHWQNAVGRNVACDCYFCRCYIGIRLCVCLSVSLYKG